MFLDIEKLGRNFQFTFIHENSVKLKEKVVIFIAFFTRHFSIFFLLPFVNLFPLLNYYRTQTYILIHSWGLWHEGKFQFLSVHAPNETLCTLRIHTLLCFMYSIEKCLHLIIMYVQLVVVIIILNQDLMNFHGRWYLWWLVVAGLDDYLRWGSLRTEVNLKFLRWISIDYSI